jgi:hypothetical protein
LLIKHIEESRMPSKETVMPKKAKTTVYMTEEEETLLNELFIKRLRERNKTDKSALLCEGIRLLYAQEIGESNDKK